MMKLNIRRQWNSYNIGTVSLESITNVHWDNISGGTGRRAPQYFLHGNVPCTIIEGDFDHSCTHGDAPHLIKVCITKKDNTAEMYQELLEIAGPRPQKIKL